MISQTTSFPLLILMAAPLLSQVPYDRILHAENEPGNWLTYSGIIPPSLCAARSDRLPNVAGLKLAWLYQTAEMHKFETTPLVVDGIMYLSEPPSHVTALDTRTGRVLWKYRRIVPQDVRVCCGQVIVASRRSATLLFIGTVDAHLSPWMRERVQSVGTSRQQTIKQGYSLTAAPLAVKDKIVSGWPAANMACADFWMPTTPARANGRGGFRPSRRRANR